MMENSDSAQVPVDFSRIQETSEGDLEFEADLFTIYLDDCELRVNRLRTAVQQGDLEAVHLEAHTIKGASANVGTTILHEIAFYFEKADADLLATSGDETLRKLDAEFGRVKETITAYLAQL